MRRDLVVVGRRDVPHADRRHHDDDGEPRLALDERHEPLVADEQPRLAVHAARVHGEEHARDVAPPDDAPRDGRVDAMVVLRRQVGDEVGAALETRRGLGVADELLEREQDALRLK